MLKKEPPIYRDHLPMFVLDVLRYDIEKVDGILELLNNRGCIGWRVFWERDFNRDEVVSALEELVQRKMVCVLREQSMELVKCDPPKNFADMADYLWFKIRKRGLEAWNEWIPPKRPDEDESDNAPQPN